MKIEAKIGLFVSAVLGALLALSTQVTQLGKWGQKGYEIYVYIPDASGIEEHSRILMSGVAIGDVQEINIEGKRVKLTLMIEEKFKIPSDSTVVVAQESLLGSKVLNVSAGDSTQSLPPQGILSNAKQYASFEQTSDSVHAAAEELTALLRDFHKTFDAPHRRALQEAIVAFRDLGVNLNGTVQENRAQLHAAIGNFNTMSAGFSQTAGTINEKLPAIMTKIDSMSGHLDTVSASLETKLPPALDKFTTIEDNVSAILAENRSGLKNTIDSAGSFFKSGDDAFGKVDALLSNFTMSELQVAMHTDYMLRDEYAKIYLGVNYLPDPTTYYIVDLISTDDYSKANQTGLHNAGKYYYNLQYGKRFDDWLLRFGAFESRGGAGIDYFAHHDTLKLSAEAFDFNAVNDYRASRVHLKTQVRYQMLKHLELYGGWDDPLNARSRNFFMGLGVRFVDNNLKYMMGSASMAR